MQKNPFFKIFILFFLFIGLILIPGCNAEIDSSSDDGSSSNVIKLKSLVVKDYVSYSKTTIYVDGPVVIKDGGLLELIDSKILMSGSLLEENNFTVKGRSRLRLINSELDGKDGYYFFFFAKCDENGGPIVEVLNNSRLSAGFGSIFQDGSVLIAKDSRIMDIVVDGYTDWDIENSKIDTISFFLKNYGTVNYEGFNMRHTFSNKEIFPGFGSARIYLKNTYVDWWRLENSGSGNLFLSESNGITLGLKSPSNPAIKRTISLDGITSRNKTDRLTGTYDFGDQQINFNNVYHEVMDIYVAGQDVVTITNSIVNEAQVWGKGELTIGSYSPSESSKIAMNIGQAVENGTMTFIRTEFYPNGSPKLQIGDNAHVIFNECDVTGLYVQISDSGILDFNDCIGAYAITIDQDGGTVRVDGNPW